MTETFGAEFLVRWLAAVAGDVDREADRLTELDSAIGDADHGANLRRGSPPWPRPWRRSRPERPARCSPPRGGSSSPRWAARPGRCTGRCCGARARRWATTSGSAGRDSRRRSAPAWPPWRSWAGPRWATRRCWTRSCRPWRRCGSRSRRHGPPPGKAPSRPCPARPQGQGELSGRAVGRAPGPGGDLVGPAVRGARRHGSRGRGGGMSPSGAEGAGPVGVVLVSHSAAVAAAVAELALGLAGGDGPPWSSRRAGRRTAVSGRVPS